MFKNLFLKGGARKLLLLDGLGAIFSAFMLSFVLVYFNEIIGIPVSVLYFLAVFPVFFAMIDFAAYYKSEPAQLKALQLIGILNLSYCVLSMVVIFFHYESIQLLGWLYMLSELLIVIILATVELNLARTLLNKL